MWFFIYALGTTVVDYIISIRVDRKYRRKRDHTSHHQGRQLHIRVNEAVAMVTQDPRFPRNHLKQVRFDTDSHVIGLDNRCSACISNKLEDFEGPVQKTNRTIKAFAGEKVTNVYTGTIVWSWLDDEGSKTHSAFPNHITFRPEVAGFLALSTGQGHRVEGQRRDSSMVK